MSKNILGTGVGGGAILVSGELNINTLSATKIQGSRITDNSIDFYAPQVELTTQDDFNININNNNNGTSSKLQVKNNNDVRMTLDDTGLDLKAGLLFKIGNSQISSANLSNDANLVKLNTANTFNNTQTFNSNIICNSIAGTESNNALIFSPSGQTLSVSLETGGNSQIVYNQANSLGSGAKFSIKNSTTPKVEVDSGGMNILDNGEISYAGVPLRNVSEVLQNKQLSQPIIATLRPTLNNVLTIPNVGSDQFCLIGHTQTLTNKTLTSPVITTPTIASLKPSNSNLISFPDESDEVVLRTSSQILTNKTLNSAVMTSFRLSSSGPNISIPVPSGNDNLVLRNHTSTLTNKTLTTPIIASLKPSASNLISFPDSTDDVVLRNATQTLNNKSLNQPSLTQPSMSQLKPNGSTTISFPTTGGADNCVYQNHSQTLTNKTISASNNTLQIASTDLTDSASFISASGNNTFTGNNTFNNQITGDITGNSLNSSFTGFFGRLNGGINRPTGNSNKFAIGPWRIDANTSSTGRRNTWSDNMTLTSSNTRVNTSFSLPSGYYMISTMVRVIDYEPANGELILFFSTAGTNFSGNVNASFPSTFSTRRVLQDQSITMNLNCCIKLTSTTSCGLMCQPTQSDTQGGFSINERSWLSVVKIRDV